MAGFYIKKVIAQSDKKETAEVTFGKGLNIIQGRSDTGKSCVVKCIEFVFGGNQKLLKTPFAPSSEYNEAVVIIGTDTGDISISRKVGKNQVTVVSDVEGIENGTYTLKYTQSGKKPALNRVMMQLLGIPGEPKVPANERFEPKHLTWTTLLRLFYVKEGRIDEEASIMEPQENYEKTPFLSGLLYLLSGRDFSEMDPQTKKEIRQARREAVEEYVRKKIKSVSDRKEKLDASMAAFDGVDVEAKIAEMVADLRKTEAEISSALEESKTLLAEILEQEKKSAEVSVLLGRYEHLRSQYKADVQRLTFIVEGDIETGKMPQVSTCPFCEGKVAVRGRKSYLDSSKAELARIIAQLKGLDSTEADLRGQQEEILRKLTALREKRTGIEELVSQELKPKADELTSAIAQYRAYIQLAREVQLVTEFAKTWNDDLDGLAIADTDEGVKIKYRPKEYFDQEFQTAMSDFADEILRECQYQNLATARFNMTTFDVEVNGEPKGSSHGKGYRSYLNTVVALMFRRYLSEHALYNPNLLIIDTPLHGFDEEDAPDSMKAGLYSYFLRHQEGQLIIIENLDHIPPLDYESSGANVITFTRKLGEGRYGFLNEVY